MSRQKQKSPVVRHASSTRVNGQIGAAILSSAIGCLIIGLMTTGAVLSEGLKNFLEWSKPVGPLSGKTGVGIIIWLIAWVVLHLILKNQETEVKKIMLISLVLLVLGFILTFPPVFEAFESHP